MHISVIQTKSRLNPDKLHMKNNCPTAILLFIIQLQNCIFSRSAARGIFEEQNVIGYIECIQNIGHMQSR